MLTVTVMHFIMAQIGAMAPMSAVKLFPVAANIDLQQKRCNSFLYKVVMHNGWHCRWCIPSEHQEMLTQWQSVKSQKT
jgi:hypothetical protein